MEKAQILSESRKISRCIRGISIVCSACCSAFFLVGEMHEERLAACKALYQWATQLPYKQ